MHRAALPEAIVSETNELSEALMKSAVTHAELIGISGTRGPSEADF